MTTSFSKSAISLLGALGLLVLSTPKLKAESGIGSAIQDYFDHWSERVEAAKVSQPDWITPLATVTPRLEQEFRYDQNRQTLKNGNTVDIYGGGKGLNSSRPSGRKSSLPFHPIR